MNTRTAPNLVLIGCLTTTIALVGCAGIADSADPPAADPTDQVIPNLQPADTTEPTESDSDATNSDLKLPVDETSTMKGQAADEGPPDGARLQTEYQPPFPDRVDYFAAPKRQGNRRVVSDGQSNEAVELVGFIDVNGLLAILSINGFEQPIAEGDSRHGIEVISIQPPGVVLQRGRQRWQATLAN